MEKWLTKDGLKAIFMDVAKAPINMSKGIYEAGVKKDVESLGTMLSVGAQMPGLITGAAITFAAGPVAGFAAYYAMTNALLSVVSATSNEAKQAFYPKISDYAANF